MIKKIFDEAIAQLNWWEAAFGMGNVLDWEGYDTATVEWAGKQRNVDTELRFWVIAQQQQHTKITTPLKTPLSVPQINWLQKHSKYVVMGLSQPGDHLYIAVLHGDGTTTPVDRCRTPIDADERLVGIPT